MPRTLTPAQKLARKHAREDAKWQRDFDRKVRARRLSRAITEMARRYASSSHHALIAARHDGPFLGKTDRQWEQASSRQHAALLRLTFALEDLAAKGA